MPSSLEKRNVVLLAACQGLFQTGNVVIVTAGGLAGFLLAPDKSLATLPISLWMIGTMAATIPASLFMGRYGRRAGFWVGALCGALFGMMATLGLAQQSFWVFCLAHFFHGCYMAFAQFYRFAAADAASAAFRSRAISYVLVGGVASAVFGPHMVALTRDLVAAGPFIASYFALVLLSGIAAALIAFIEVPAPVAPKSDAPARPMSAVASQPTFLVAVGVAAIGFGVMNLAMTATPLAMQHHHHSLTDTAFVIQWHVLGMFLPSFFTGSLIARFGAPQVMLAGVGLLLAHVAIALSGVEYLHFVSALTLLGVGWNFTYLGGTSLVTEAYRPSEKAWAQGVNDFTIFASVVLASFSSGALLHFYGWTGVNLLAAPLLVAAGIALIWYLYWQRNQPAPAAHPSAP